MQDRAKANHDLGKDAMITHVLAKGSMVANPFFFRILSIRNHGFIAKFMFPIAALDVIPVLHSDLIPQTFLH